MDYNNPSKFGAFKERAAGFLKKHGFYVVLGLCALCAGIAALAHYLPGSGQTQAPTPTQQLAQQVGQSDDERLKDVVELATPTPTITQSPQSTPDEPPAATPKQPEKAVSAAKAPNKAAAPVEGKVIWGYAVDTLLYSKTLDQWTTHEGVDIAAKLGAAVKAVRGGTIQKVYEDNSLGITVTVLHDDGVLSLYANLAKDPPVKAGQLVNAGDTLGEVGESAVSECGLEPHLHFALYKKETPLDPYEHVLLGK
ncbi:M23 family metallopeptidase [Eubacteriales bacterium OttesenSCG-928-K08]|nr:M23 family metallopeptidase [Eubacteriales bacterium OttesenSCG-928-K08]